MATRRRSRSQKPRPSAGGGVGVRSRPATSTSFDEEHLQAQVDAWVGSRRAKLGDVLVAAGTISADDLLEALAVQRRARGRSGAGGEAPDAGGEAPEAGGDDPAAATPVGGPRLGEVLIDLGVLGEDSLAGALAEQFGVRTADLTEEDVEHAAVERVPEEVARRHGVLPWRVEGDRVLVVVSDPLDTDAIVELTATCRNISLVIGPRAHIDRLIDRTYDALSTADDVIRAFELTAAEQEASSDDTFRVDESAPVVQVVNRILTQGVRSRASDIHVQPGHGDVRVRFRVDGAMTDAIRLPSSMGPAVASRLKVMAELNIVERRKPQDGQFSVSVDGRPIDVRLSVVPTIDGEKSVMRLLDKTGSVISVDQLGMVPSVARPFLDMVRAPLGMVLCTGPTGSGKTTSLYAALQEVNDPTKTVVTIEDPVEYQFDGIAQMQVSDTGMDFAEGLRGILRQDPDVILVGEIRDAETARIAMQAALTGHLVLSSLHAIDAVSAVHRFIGMGIEPFLVGSAINGVVAQRLLRRLCRACRAETIPNPNELRLLAEITDGILPETWFRPKGCNLCAGTGYRDRVGVYELLRFTDTVRELVAARAAPSEIKAEALADGMRTMQQQAFLMVADGVTTVEEVMRCVYAPTATDTAKGPAELTEGRRAISAGPASEEGAA